MNQQRPRTDSAPIPFIDVGRPAPPARPRDRRRDRARARRTASSSMGPEVAAFESDLAAFCGARYAVSCASGTDALMLVLMAKGIGPGDAVICPAFTFCATAEVVALLGATPVFADVDADTFNLERGERSSARSRRRSATGLKPKVLIPVDLFGLPADHDALAGRREGGRAVRARRRRAGVRRAPTRAASSAPSRQRPRRASFRPSRSAATATAARS